MRPPTPNRTKALDYRVAMFNSAVAEGKAKTGEFSQEYAEQFTKKQLEQANVFSIAVVEDIARTGESSLTEKKCLIFW